MYKPKISRIQKEIPGSKMHKLYDTVNIHCHSNKEDTLFVELSSHSLCISGTVKMCSRPDSRTGARSWHSLQCSPSSLTSQKMCALLTLSFERLCLMTAGLATPPSYLLPARVTFWLATILQSPTHDIFEVRVSDRSQCFMY